METVLLILGIVALATVMGAAWYVVHSPWYVVHSPSKTQEFLGKLREDNPTAKTDEVSQRHALRILALAGHPYADELEQGRYVRAHHGVPMMPMPKPTILLPAGDRELVGTLATSTSNTAA